MGEEVDQQEFSREDRTRYREKVRRCLDVFARMLRESAFDADYPMTGLEIELNLVDDAGDPALKNAEALEAIADPDFVTELGQFNLEINVAPKQLKDRGFSAFEDGVRASLNAAEAKANQVGAHMVMIGILPTLSAGHMSPDSLSPNPRYRLLSDQILRARGEDIRIQIQGAESLQTTVDTIVPEAACTSTQLHVQVSPERFAAYWNASQAISGIQLALGATSRTVPAAPSGMVRVDAALWNFPSRYCGDLRTRSPSGFPPNANGTSRAAHATAPAVRANNAAATFFMPPQRHPDRPGRRPPGSGRPGGRCRKPGRGRSAIPAWCRRKPARRCRCRGRSRGSPGFPGRRRSNGPGR